jgi:TorA maturation chaperone TorD
MLLAVESEAVAAKDEPDWLVSAGCQEEFIAGHPLEWIADLERDASTHGAIGFYAALLELIRGVLLWDCELLGEFSIRT